MSSVDQKNVGWLEYAVPRSRPTVWITYYNRDPFQRWPSNFRHWMISHRLRFLTTTNLLDEWPEFEDRAAVCHVARGTRHLACKWNGEPVTPRSMWGESNCLFTTNGIRLWRSEFIIMGEFVPFTHGHCWEDGAWERGHPSGNVVRVQLDPQLALEEI